MPDPSNAEDLPPEDGFQSSQKGWVKLHRQLLDHPYFENGDFVKLWVTLLLLATHRPRKVAFNGGLIELKPGQLICSRDSLSKKLNMSTSKVERWLNKLKSEQQIEQQSGSTSRLISILKWDCYQSIEQQNGQPSDSDRTAGGQRPDTNKNDKECTRSKKSAKIALNPEELISAYSSKPAFAGIDVKSEIERAQHWCDLNSRKFSERFFGSWMLRAKAPGATGGANGSSKVPVWQQLKALDAKIEVHPANKSYRRFGEIPLTDAMVKELAALREQRTNLAASQLPPHD